jgi:hypothetical protein
MADIVGAFEAMDDGKDKLSEFLARHVTISSIKFYAFVTKMKKFLTQPESHPFFWNTRGFEKQGAFTCAGGLTALFNEQAQAVCLLES